MSDSGSRSASFQLILETAEQLIAEKGCRQTTLQDIIDRSGLSKGAIYHYVSGKDELFGLILKSKMEVMNGKFNEVVAGAAAGDAVQPIRTISQGMLDRTNEQEVSNKIFTYLLSQIDNPKIATILKDVYEFSLQTASRWIETGQQAGAIPPAVDAQKMAAIFMVFTYGLRVHNVIAKDVGGAIEFEDIFRLIFRTLQ